MNKKTLLFQAMEAGDYSKLSVDNAKAAFVKSIVTRDQLDTWYDDYEIDRSKFELFLSDDPNVVLKPPAGAVAIYQIQLEMGLRFPLDSFHELLLKRYGFSSSQLKPNATMNVVGFAARARAVGVPATEDNDERMLRIFRSNFELITRDDDIGRYAMRSKSGGTKFFADMGRRSVVGWEDKYAFIKSATEIPLFLHGSFRAVKEYVNKRPSEPLSPMEQAIQKVMTYWVSPAKEKINPTSLEDFVMKYLEKHSQLSVEARFLLPKTTSSAWKKIGDVAKAITTARSKNDEVGKSEKGTDRNQRVDDDDVVSEAEPSLKVPVQTAITKKLKCGKTVAYKRHLLPRYKSESSHTTPSKKMKKNDATSTDGSEGCETVNLELSDESDFQDEEEIPDTEAEIVGESVLENTPKKRSTVIPEMPVAQRTILKGKKTVRETSSPIVAEKIVKEKNSNQEMPPPAMPSSPEISPSPVVAPSPVVPPSPSAVDLVVNDNKLMELMDIAMSSARKGKKGDSSDSTEFSGSPVDKLIVEVAKLQQSQIEGSYRFERLSQELMLRLVALQAVLKNEMKLSAQLQNDMISYKMTADRFTLLVPTFSDENDYQKEIRRLCAEMEILKERLKRKEAEVLSWELQNRK